MGQPTIGVLADAANQVEELLLDLRRDRTTAAGSNRDSIDASHWRDFGRGAREKNLIGGIEHLSRNGLLADRHSHVARQRDNTVPRDAVEKRSVDRRRVENAP